MCNVFTSLGKFNVCRTVFKCDCVMFALNFILQLFYDEKFAESGALANVFDIKSVGLPSSAKYSGEISCFSSSISDAVAIEWKITLK
jgi:hypothetical protein